MRKRKKVVSGPRRHQAKQNPLLSLRMQPEQMELLEAAALRDGYELQPWARAALLRAAKVHT